MNINQINKIKPMSWTKYFLPLIFFFLVIFTCCQENQSNKKVKVDFSKKEDINSQINESGIPLRVAVSAMISPEENFHYYTKIFNYLSQQLNREIIFKQRKTYSEVNTLLRSRELDFAFICSGAYVEAKEDFGAEILVIPQIFGKTSYHAYIIVRSDSDCEKFEDLKGLSFAFTDPLSNTGCIYPRFLVKQMNFVEDNFFSRVIFTYAHDFSIQAVDSQLTDAASVDSIIYDYFQTNKPHKVDKLKIVNKSEPFGMPPVVVHPGIEPSLRKNLETIFLKMNEDPQGREILDHLNIDRFVRGKDEDYESIKKMKALLEEKGNED